MRAKASGLGKQTHSASSSEVGAAAAEDAIAAHGAAAEEPSPVLPPRLPRLPPTFGSEGQELQA
jgi:hypothetical protein